MVSVIPLVIGAIGAILLVANIGKIRDLIPSGNGNGNGTTIIEGATTIIEAGDLPPQNGTKQETERQIIIITGEQVAPPTPSEPSLPPVIRGKTEQDLSILKDFGERQEARIGIELAIDPRLKFSTSLAESQFLVGSQIKRDPRFVGGDITNFQVSDASSTFQQTLRREQERAAALSLKLFGSIQNPDFPRFTTKEGIVI